ncbi:hypothetical protein WISP_143584 [Willisornis vidua]|uniref:Uncharacterized protein n=1 Tax=Willisornis vidua TaxID=1566151 RepID=A0ABQ9CLI8_9PASS|nr:hypothetical protein WISP_143584 [Willisornis vidua]
MEDHRLPKIVLCGELATGCCKRGASKKRYKDSLKQHLSLGHIDCHQWSVLASSWDSWRHTIHDAAASFESACRVSLEEKRQLRKNHSSLVLPKEMFRCAFCDQTCLSCIGLFRHQHACSKCGSGSLGKVPEDRKEADVTPIFKKGKKKDTKNYNQVNLFLVSGTMMEELILESTSRHVKDKKVIRRTLHGFTKRKSTWWSSTMNAW